MLLGTVGIFCLGGCLMAEGLANRIDPVPPVLVQVKTWSWYAMYGSIALSTVWDRFAPPQAEPFQVQTPVQDAAWLAGGIFVLACLIWAIGGPPEGWWLPMFAVVAMAGLAFLLWRAVRRRTARGDEVGFAPPADAA